MSSFSTRLIPVVAVLTLGVLAHTADAQPAPQPQPQPQVYAPPQPDVRSGWNFGGGLGAGNISCSGDGCPDDDFLEAGSVDLHVGYLLRPRLNVVGTFWTMAHSEDEWTLRHTIVTAAMQYWIINRLWVQGGVGYARASVGYDGVIDVEDSTENVFAIAGAIGFEIFSRRKWSLGLAVRGGTGFYEDLQARNEAFTLDFTWY